MNLYLKYGPLAYTRNTRISHKWEEKLPLWTIILNLFWYLFITIWIGWLSLVYFYIAWIISLSNFFISLWLFIVVFLIYSIFYEIWYLHNSIVAKKEKNPTIRVYEKVPKNFYTTQILIRILSGAVCLAWLYFFDKSIWLMLLWIVILTQVVYFIHNIIRNYFYNYMTLLLLRILKFSLIFIILYFIFWSFDSIYYLYLTILFLLYQQFDHTCWFNKRMWWENKLKTNLWLYFYSFMSCGLLFLLTFDYIFIYYWIIFFLIFIILTPKEQFKLKNDR